MREHKYRAWHREEKQMYWFDITWGNFGLGGGWIGMVPITEKKVTYSPSNQAMISPGSVELMEYTGKEDSEGDDICEGDILRYDNEAYSSSSGLYVIEWSIDDDDCGFVCERENPYNYLMPCLWSTCRVVGNIYENPELLSNANGGLNDGRPNNR